MGRQAAGRSATAAAGTAGLAAALVLGLAGPARADRVVIDDPKGDSFSGADHKAHPESSEYGDITRLVLRHESKRVKLTVALNPRTSQPDLYEASLDTRKDRAGAEYRLYFGKDPYDSSVYVQVYRRGSGAETACRGARSAAIKGPSQWKGGGHRVSIPRRCLGRPQQVRAWVASGQEHGIDDYAPGRTKYAWSRWARRG